MLQRAVLQRAVLQQAVLQQAHVRQVGRRKALWAPAPAVSQCDLRLVQNRRASQTGQSPAVRGMVEDGFA